MTYYNNDNYDYSGNYNETYNDYAESVLSTSGYTYTSSSSSSSSSWQDMFYC